MGQTSGAECSLDDDDDEPRIHINPTETSLVSLNCFFQSSNISLCFSSVLINYIKLVIDLNTYLNNYIDFIIHLSVR